MQPVVVTGLGAVTGVGLNAVDFWAAVSSGRSGVRPLTGFSPGQFKIPVAVQVQGFESLGLFTENEWPVLDRHAQFAIKAALEATDDAGLNPAQLTEAATVIGTGCGGKETDEITYHRLYEEGRSRVHPLTIPRGMPSAAASQISMRLGTTGPAFMVSSACASANHAIAQAVMLIRSEVTDLAIAGGADAPFSYGLLKAWDAMRVVTRDTCRPFSVDRSGMVLGEGAGVLVLESLEHARSRGARVYGELAGIGMSADAAHIVDPSSDGAVRAMSSALKDARLAPHDVDYVNAHGTGTRSNDISETQALKMLFRSHAQALAISSTKPVHGHALGASGAMELIATLLALKSDLAPPTINFSRPGEGCDLDYVPNQARVMRIDVALSNSFAFGGLNAVLAIRSV
ncbi:MAG: beta-ketoacyl-[acyl-carrier-protein] synthase family protein [Gammaproteobacteria bacterium]|nr:beta-ketoacyl-[acyl-carrier-protein] synthase family protein [Gammaproteobacteria bacterium]